LRGLRAVGWLGSLPLYGAPTARVQAGVVSADRAAPGLAGWDYGRGLPVTPADFGMRARIKAWRGALT